MVTNWLLMHGYQILYLTSIIYLGSYKSFLNSKFTKNNTITFTQLHHKYTRYMSSLGNFSSHHNFYTYFHLRHSVEFTYKVGYREVIWWEESHNIDTLYVTSEVADSVNVFKYGRVRSYKVSLVLFGKHFSWWCLWKYYFSPSKELLWSCVYEVFLSSFLHNYLVCCAFNIAL